MLSPFADTGQALSRNRAKLLVLWFDAYETTIADRMMSEGRLPHLAQLKSSSCRFSLDHGSHKYTGLAGEHFSTGMAPDVSHRCSVVDFNTRTYEVIQRSALFEPLLGRIGRQAIVFDVPYFDMTRAPQAWGLVNWGAHDLGIAPMSRPGGLRDEIIARFNSYPASDYIYAFDWPSPLKTQAAGEALVAGLDQRARIARWLLCERFPEWDVALVLVSELHSAIESMWHGLDPSHPLHHHESAKPARIGLERVYQALDRFVESLLDSIPDAAVLAFSMHGMGANDADVPTMLLLPELLYRLQFGHPLYQPRPEWREGNSLPLLNEPDHWDYAIRCCFEMAACKKQRIRSRLRGLPKWIGSKLSPKSRVDRLDMPLDWMAATLYQPYWYKMRAFALPGFLNGRIRLNLIGRERHGTVAVSEYDDVCRKLEDILKACRDPQTGASVVESVERGCSGDPLLLDASNADLNVLWRGSPLAFLHEDLGLIGPAPFRRTGGHTGGYGICYIKSPGTVPGDYGVRSSFDVPPTILQMLGEPIPQNISGMSLFRCG